MGNGVSTDEVPIELADLHDISHFPKAADRKTPVRCVRAWAFREGMNPTAIPLASATPALLCADTSYIVLSITKPHNNAESELEDSWKNWAHFVYAVMTPRGVMTPVSVLDRYVGGLQVSVWVWNGTKSPWGVRSEALVTALHLDRTLKWETSIQGLLDIATAQVNSCEPLASPRSPMRGSWIRGFRRLLGCVTLQSACFPNLRHEVNSLTRVVPDAPPVVVAFEAAPMESDTGTPRCPLQPTRTPRQPQKPAMKPEVLKVIGLDSLDRGKHDTHNSINRGIKRDNEALDEPTREVPKIPLKRGSFGLDLGQISTPPQQERNRDVPEKRHREMELGPISTPRQQERNWDLPEKRHRELELDQTRPVCSEIISGKLFLAGHVVASSRETLLAHGITHIVNTAGDVCESSFPDDCAYLTYYLKDTKEEDISAIFYRTFDFIDHAIAAGGRVLVHCREGVSRSCTVVVAYLMYKYRVDCNTAFNKVKEIRVICNPNPGFTCQLLMLQKRLQIDGRGNGVSVDTKKTAYRVSIHDARQPFLVLLSFNFARKVEVIPYDSRFGFVLRQGSTIMGWIGLHCINKAHVEAAIEEYARWVEKYEGVQVDLKVFEEGDESLEFWEWNDVEQPGPEGFISMRPEFDQDMADMMEIYSAPSSPPDSPRTPADDERMQARTPVNDERMEPLTFLTMPPHACPAMQPRAIPAMPPLAFSALQTPAYSSVPHDTPPRRESDSASPAMEDHDGSPVMEYLDGSPAMEYHDGSPAEEYHDEPPAMEYHNGSPVVDHHDGSTAINNHDRTPTTESRACRAIPNLGFLPKTSPLCVTSTLPTRAATEPAASSAMEPQVLLFDTAKMNSPCHRRVVEDLDKNKSFLLVALGSARRAFLWIGKDSSDIVAHKAAEAFLQERHKDLLTQLSVVQQGSESTDFWRYFKAD